MELPNYRDLLTDMTEEIAQSLRLTSAVSRGRPRNPGRLLGTTGTEFYLVTSETFDLSALIADWESASPLRYLRHPVTSFNMDRLLGKPISDETGCSVVLINIPLLGCQYQLWRKRYVLGNLEQPLSIAHFVAGYVLTNALTSFMDITYLNSLIKRFNQLPLSNSMDNHPFYHNPYTVETTEGIDAVLKLYTRSRVPFIYTLEGLSGFTQGSLREAITLPELPFTQGVIAVLTLARLPLVAFLLKWNATINRSAHNYELNRIKISLKSFLNNKLISQLGEEDFQRTVKTEIEEQILPLL
jgi:hypothetical protein